MADERLFWCNSHQRKATHVDTHGKPECNPELGGIMIPCRVVDLTDKVEIHEDDQDGV